MYSNLPNCKIVKNCDFWNIKFPKSIWDSMKRDDELNELKVILDIVLLSSFSALAVHSSSTHL